MASERDTATTTTQRKTTEQIDLRGGSVPASGEWRNYRHDNLNSSYAPEATGAPESGTPYWRITNGYMPAISKKTMYLRSGTGGVLALDARTGDRRWRTDVDASGPAPAIANDDVFFTHSESITSLDATSGSVNWTTELKRGIVSAPTVVDETLYFAHSEYYDKPVSLFAIDAATGEEIWNAEVGGEYSPSDIVVTSGEIFVTTEKLHSIDRKTGTERWSVSVSGSVDTVPVVRDSLVFVGDLDGVVYAIDIESQQVIWRAETGASNDSGGIAVTDEIVFYSGTEAVHALESRTGEQRWRFSTQSTAAPATVADETVYFGTGVHGRYLRALDTTTGTENWRYRFPRIEKGDMITGGVLDAPVVVDDALYVRTAGDFLYAFGNE
ncbi:outer membrane protein assembly factor BamB family protein [Halorussus halophilus]|uniref:outer membrane protein assembly factor BamB family protein n=1 Tax=Halorussus halophilus TaxID=2650975 RepID=UPI0017889E04|nr:PQQ-binding-like beta-propeller repeat protein [Halorussus halophilus]